MCSRGCRCNRQSYFNYESAAGPVHCRDPATVEAHRTLGDRQSKTDAARVAAASIVQAVEGLKQFFQRISRNTVAAISHPDYRLANCARALFQLNLHYRAFAGIADRVARDILDRTV